MEFIKKESIKNLKNSGVISKQLLSPANSESDSVTITEVHLEPKAMQNRHSHKFSDKYGTL